MTLGLTPRSPDLYRSTRALCEPKLSATSMYRLLAEQGQALFPDESFADLFDDVGRRSVPPRIVATVMVLERIAGASDREAVDLFAFDLRWTYAWARRLRPEPLRGHRGADCLRGVTRRAPKSPARPPATSRSEVVRRRRCGGGLRAEGAEGAARPRTIIRTLRHGAATGVAATSSTRVS